MGEERRRREEGGGRLKKRKGWTEERNVEREKKRGRATGEGEEAGGEGRLKREKKVGGGWREGRRRMEKR